jgi:hypothetical protein
MAKKVKAIVKLQIIAGNGELSRILSMYENAK